MDDSEWLARQFERHRPRLRSIAFRMLGSLAEADDAVQDAWLRVSRAGVEDVENLDGWLTTIVARVSLNMLRSRDHRHEQPLDAHVPDPVSVVAADRRCQPEEEALLADSVGLALLIVLDTLSPDERLAFVLHDTFGLPLKEIGDLLGRTTPAAKQLASRARQRVKGASVPADPDVARQREAVDAFFAASRAGDFGALVAVLHPDVLVRIDAGASASLHLRGAEAVARQALSGFQRILANPATELLAVLVNGSAGVVVTLSGRPIAVISFIVADGQIMEIDSIADPSRVPKIAAGLTIR
jgi:RNA polymerase sigma factor (sigma-70 family)